ncbi:hypothetical protein Zmor_027563 [Zophobas morio]|uniref:Uncharacterized protein n=1 Tax=Zophobas morio TaxID=2755281 RepID=A0AA38HNX9_9CUCU|nr:hypothetical protein Zmor_027563 [Zophobas morio]
MMFAPSLSFFLFATIVVEINSSNIITNSSVPIILADAFSDFPSLTELRLLRRGIEEIRPGALNNLPLLKTVKLGQNKLTNIEDGVFSNSTIEVLFVDHNLIENISPHAFDNMRKLVLLDLVDNKIKNFHPEWLQGKPKLEGVNLQYNQIEHLASGIFANFHNDVHLHHNKIKSVSRDIFGTDDKIVFGQLSLGYNEIEEWKEDFVKGGEIRALAMMSNKIQCLEGNYENFFVARQTYIDNNPWDCECLLKIAKWTVDNQKDFGINVENSAKKCNSTGKFPTMIM